MNSKVIETKKEIEIEYPCVMRSEQNRLVLFWQDGYGMVVGNPSKTQPLGHYSTNWGMCCFTPFEGTVELSN